MKNELEIKLDSKAQEVIGEVAKEHGGGGSTYTAGNGIEITDENVINADTKVIVYNGDLSELPNDILVSLNIGDALSVYDTYYFVKVKTQGFVVITSVDTSSIVAYVYQKDGDYYRYDHQDERWIPEFYDSAYLDANEGEIDREIYDKIEYFNYCTTDYGMAISIGWDEEEDTIKLSTVVQDNKYYTISFTYNEPESEEEEASYSYVITEHTLSNGGGDIGNLCDYYPRLAAINGKQMFEDNSYYFDVDAFIQYVEDSGVEGIPFEPNIDGTEPNGIELITYRASDIVNGLSVYLQTQTSTSNSYLSIDFAGNYVPVNDLINEEGDTLLEFLTRNKDAIKEVVTGTSFSGLGIRNKLGEITSDEMCICKAWVISGDNPTYAHSMNFMKFLEIFVPSQPE